MKTLFHRKAGPLFAAALLTLISIAGMAAAQDLASHWESLKTARISQKQVPDALAKASEQFEDEVNDDKTISLSYSGMSSPVVRGQIDRGVSKTNGLTTPIACGGDLRL